MSDERDGLLRLAGVTLSKGDWAAAEKALTRLRAIDPADVPSTFNLALVMKRQRRTAEAETLLAEVVSRAPDYLKARFELAASMMERGAHEDALHQFEAYLTAAPLDADAHLNAGRLAHALGRLEAARGHLVTAATARPDDAPTRLSLAEVMRDLGLMDEADAIFRSLAREHPALRPAVLRAMTQGPKGRLQLDAFAP